MDFIQEVISRAKQRSKRIVLPESYDARILQAAQQISNEGFAEVVLLGCPDKIAELAAQKDIDLAGVHIMHTASDPHFSTHVQSFYEHIHRT